MSFDPEDRFRRLTSIDAHTAGEPLRVITGGWPEPEGKTILEKRAFARRHQDALRRALMLEPRGHADMYGCLPVAPETDDADFGVLFLHNEGYSTMCGHGIVGVVTVALETGAVALRAGVDPKTVGAEDAPVLRIDSPAGRITARAEHVAGRVRSVAFDNVPSFVAVRDGVVEVEGLGSVRFDLAYGGAFYAYVDAADVGVSLEPRHFVALVDVGMRIKRAVIEQVPIRHPDGDADLEFLYGTILVGPPGDSANHSRNVCVFADGEVDRSPTGTGVSGRVAIHHARGELDAGAWIRIESLLGTTFDVRVARETRVADRAAVVPEVRGAAYLTGRHEFWIDPEDPLADGVLLR